MARIREDAAAHKRLRFAQRGERMAGGMRNPRYQVLGLALIALLILALTIARFGRVIKWTVP